MKFLLAKVFAVSTIAVTGLSFTDQANGIVVGSKFTIDGNAILAPEAGPGITGDGTLSFTPSGSVSFGGSTDFSAANLVSISPEPVLWNGITTGEGTDTYELAEALVITLNNVANVVGPYTVTIPIGTIFSRNSTTLGSSVYNANISALGSDNTPFTGSFAVNATTTISQDDLFAGEFTAVPFESDVLPLIGATVLFGGGMWLKRKRAEKSLAALQETQETERG